MALTIPITGGGTILSGNSYGRALIRRHVTLHQRPSLHVASAKKFSSRGGKSRRDGSTTTEERERSAEMDVVAGGERTAAQISGGEYPGYFLPELPGDKPCFWEGEKWDALGFFVEYLWALGFLFALVACGVAVATYNDGATDFKETPAYKESIQTQEFLDDPEASAPDVFESNPTEVEREIHIAAEDLRSANSHETGDMFSDIDDLESIVLHIKENKVTLIRRKSAMSKVSGRRQANGSTAFYRNLYRRASRIARFSSLTYMGINGMLLPKKSKYDFH